MMGYCEKMKFVPSTANQWPQMNDQIDDEKGVTMEKLQSSEALRCPRCDSSNTKFCYYNNYSLSQPRHFCKSCKRYWTRGGTLRNVPVGGGCRKNKRAKRPPPATSTSASIDAPPPPPSSSTTSSSNPSSAQPNPLFYGTLPTNHPSRLTLPYPPTINSRASNINHSADLSGFDLQPQLINGLGLGFSSDVPDNNFGFVNHNKQIQDFLTSNSLFSGYSMFGSSTSVSPTIASLLAPRALDEQPKFISNSLKEVKMEESQNGLSWNNFPLPNQMDQISPSDSSMFWNTTSTGSWIDPTSVGSSVPSLI